MTVDATPGTALYDAVVAAAKALRASTQPGRVIIVLTDGHDVSSSSSLDAAVAAARKAKRFHLSDRRGECRLRSHCAPDACEGDGWHLPTVRARAPSSRPWYASIGVRAPSHVAPRLRHLGTARRSSGSPHHGSRGSERSSSRSRFRCHSERQPPPRCRVSCRRSSTRRSAPSSSRSSSGRPLPRGDRLAGPDSAVEAGSCSGLLHTSRRRLSRAESRPTGLSFLKALFKATEGNVSDGHAKWRSIERLLVRGQPARSGRPSSSGSLIGCAVGAGVLSSAPVRPRSFVLVGMVLAPSCRTASSRSA